MVRLMLRIWLLFILLGTALLLSYCFLFTASHFTAGEGVYLTIVALVISFLGTMPLMVGLRLLAACLLRAYGLQSTRGLCTVYGMILIPVTFLAICACFPAESAALFAAMSIPYVLSYAMLIWILKWPETVSEIQSYVATDDTHA